MKPRNFAHRVMTPELAAIALTGLMIMMAQPANAETVAESAVTGASIGLPGE